MTAQQIKVRRQRPQLWSPVPHGIMRNPELSDKAVRVYGVLMSYADFGTLENCRPSMDTLAVDCGNCHRATVQRAVRELVKANLLLVESGKTAGLPNVYVLLEPPETVQRVLHGCATPSRARSRPGGASARDPGGAPARDDLDPGNQEPGTNTGAMATDDPIVRHAHTLAQLAYEQPVKPVTRGDFGAVITRIEEQLRAGTSVQRVEAAILSGEVTWTRDGLQTAINRANPRARPRANSDGDDRSVVELQQAARRGQR